MGTIRFEIRGEKADKKGRCPLRIVYQVSGNRKYIPTELKLFPENWDAKEQRALYLDKKA